MEITKGNFKLTILSSGQWSLAECAAHHNCEIHGDTLYQAKDVIDLLQAMATIKKDNRFE